MQSSTVTRAMCTPAKVVFCQQIWRLVSRRPPKRKYDFIVANSSCCAYSALIASRGNRHRCPAFTSGLTVVAGVPYWGMHHFPRHQRFGELRGRIAPSARGGSTEVLTETGHDSTTVGKDRAVYRRRQPLRHRQITWLRHRLQTAPS